MIILYDDVGRITQTFMFVAPSLEEYAETVLDPLGKTYLFVEGSSPDIMDKYIDVATKTLIARPRVGIGVDADKMEFNIAVGVTLNIPLDQTAKVRIIANYQVIASETVSDGLLELSFDHPGLYSVEIGGDFPIYETVLNIEVV